MWCPSRGAPIMSQCFHPAFWVATCVCQWLAMLGILQVLSTCAPAKGPHSIWPVYLDAFLDVFVHAEDDILKVNRYLMWATVLWATVVGQNGQNVFCGPRVGAFYEAAVAGAFVSDAWQCCCTGWYLWFCYGQCAGILSVCGLCPISYCCCLWIQIVAAVAVKLLTPLSSWALVSFSAVVVIIMPSLYVVTVVLVANWRFYVNFGTTGCICRYRRFVLSIFLISVLSDGKCIPAYCDGCGYFRCWWRNGRCCFMILWVVPSFVTGLWHCCSVWLHRFLLRC